MRYFNKDSRDYEFTEKYEAGIVLNGADAKSLRVQPPKFSNSKIEVVDGQPIIFDLKIPRYKYAQGDIDTTTQRNLLLSAKEIAKIQSLRHQKYMIIPISIKTVGRWFKVEIGIGRKLRKYEKRQKIKDKELKKKIK